MPRYKLTIAYDGTDFCGWQKQEPPLAQAEGTGSMKHVEEGLDAGEPGRVALRTVQGVLERAVREVVREKVELMGASRTDSGVHARGQVATFPATDDPASIAKGSGWPLERGTVGLVRAINGRLPEDVLVVGAEAVAGSFNPVTDCTGKAYSYAILASRTRPLWDRKYVHQVWEPLDLARMREAAALLVGEHDFAAFAAAGHGRVSTVRRVFSCEVREVEAGDGVRVDAGAGERMGVASLGGAQATLGPGTAHPTTSGGEGLMEARRFRIDIAGSGFLWNMVRIIAGTIADAGRGRLEADSIREALRTGDRRKAGPTFPASGLCLEWVRY